MSNITVNSRYSFVDGAKVETKKSPTRLKKRVGNDSRNKRRILGTILGKTPQESSYKQDITTIFYKDSGNVGPH